MKYPKEWIGFKFESLLDDHMLFELMKIDSIGNGFLACVECKEKYEYFYYPEAFKPLTPAAREVAAEIKAWGSK